MTCSGAQPVHVEVGCYENISFGSCLPCNCNGHGSCGTNGKCQCETGWSGDFCLKKTGSFEQCAEIDAKIKKFNICGNIYVDKCALTAALTLDGNELVAQDFALVPALRKHGEKVCVEVKPCNICLQVSSLALSANQRSISGSVDASLKCALELKQSLGSFRSEGDFTNIEQRCYPCKSNCSTPRGSCSLDTGACACSNANYYGSNCEFTRCASTCSGPTQGNCDAYQGKCVCVSGYGGDDCSQKQNTVMYVLIAAAVIVVVGVGAGLFIVWWRRRKAAASTTDVDGFRKIEQGSIQQATSDSDWITDGDESTAKSLNSEVEDI